MPVRTAFTVDDWEINIRAVDAANTYKYSSLWKFVAQVGMDCVSEYINVLFGIEHEF